MGEDSLGGPVRWSTIHGRVPFGTVTVHDVHVSEVLLSLGQDHPLVSVQPSSESCQSRFLFPSPLGNVLTRRGQIEAGILTGQPDGKAILNALVARIVCLMFSALADWYRCD